MKVHTLLGKREIETAIPCLTSLRHALPIGADLIVHDDGTLDSFDEDRLTNALAPQSFRLIHRSEADIRMAEALRNCPHSLAYRNSHPMGLKLLDVPLLEEAENFWYCDSDILFVARPAHWSIDANSPVFCQEDFDGYSGSLWRLRYRLGIKLIRGLNAGFFHLPSHLHDLDFIEWFLGRPETRRVEWLVEQTAWAALMAKQSTLMISPTSLHCSRFTAPSITPDTLAIHFMQPIRHLLPDFLPHAVHAASGAHSVGFSLIPAQPLRWHHILSRPLRRLLSRQ